MSVLCLFRWVKRDSYLYFDTVGNIKCVCTVFVQMGEERQLPTHGQSELEGSGKGECV